MEGGEKGGHGRGAEGGREMGGERGECVSVGERGCEKKSRRKKSNVKDPTRCLEQTLSVQHQREEGLLFLTLLERELAHEPERNDIPIA